MFDLAMHAPRTTATANRLHIVRLRPTVLDGGAHACSSRKQNDRMKHPCGLLGGMAHGAVQMSVGGAQWTTARSECRNARTQQSTVLTLRYAPLRCIPRCAATF